VLLMELIRDDDGEVAPRLNDVSMSADQAREDFADIIRDIVRMLCAGLVHGDLSEFNVLVDAYGPVIIDLPQAVDAVSNNHAEWMLERDVNNMRDYYGQFAPELLSTQFAKEIWAIYESGKLTPDTELTGLFDEPEDDADVDSVLLEIKEAFAEEQERLERISAANEE
ncbi:MAG: RIO1 family regulatory kinase/ATPase, partial [Lentilitoribacter sp.]